MNASEVISGVFIGDATDGMEWREGRVLCVHERGTPRRDAMQMRILLPAKNPAGFIASRAQLEAAALVIAGTILAGDKILVHCGQGVERAPLTVAWWLRSSGLAESMEDAYAMVMARRKQAQDRRHWIEPA